MPATAKKIKAARAEVDACKLKLSEAKRALDAWEVDTDSREVIDMYEETLDCDGDVTVCGMAYAPSQIMKAVDETAYRCGLNDWADGLDKESFREYTDLQSAVEEAEVDLTSAEEALEALEEA